MYVCMYINVENLPLEKGLGRKEREVERGREGGEREGREKGERERERREREGGRP